MRPLAGMAICAMALTAQIKFTRVETPHFEVYTDGGNEVATTVLRRLEPVRAFFEESMSGGTGIRKARVVVLQGRKGYEAFRPKRATTSWVAELPHRNLLVTGSIRSKEDIATLNHEVAHLLVHQTGMRIPLWLNEGIAEIYESLQPLDGAIRIGVQPRIHTRRLETDDWLNLKQMFLADSYGEERHDGPFYAASWAVTHMLMMEQDLRDKFARFLDAVQRGVTGEQAIREVYGLTPEQLETHVRGYMRLTDLNTMQFPLRWEKPDVKLAAAPATPFETASVMADLYFASGNLESAAEHAERARAAEPARPEAYETLAAVRWRERKLPEVVQAGLAALERGSKNAEVLAIAAGAAKEDRNTAKRLVDGAIAADGDNLEARLQLAGWLVEGKEYAKALSTLQGIRRLSFSDRLRYAPLHEQAASQAQGRPQTEDTASGRFVAGQLTRVECANGKVTLHLATAEGPQAFPVDSGHALEVTGGSPNVGCGEQRRKRRVRLGVTPEGLVRKLEYSQ